MDDMLMTLVDTEENGRQLFIEPQYLGEDGKWRRINNIDRLPSIWQDNELEDTAFTIASKTGDSVATVSQAIQILKNTLGVE